MLTMIRRALFAPILHHFDSHFSAKSKLSFLALFPEVQLLHFNQHTHTAHEQRLSLIQEDATLIPEDLFKVSTSLYVIQMTNFFSPISSFIPVIVSTSQFSPARFLTIQSTFALISVQDYHSSLFGFFYILFTVTLVP